MSQYYVNCSLQFTNIWKITRGSAVTETARRAMSEILSADAQLYEKNPTWKD